MMTPAGKERTIEDFRKVLDEAGLQLTGVFQHENDNFGLVEARLKTVTVRIEALPEVTSSVEVSPTGEVFEGKLLPPLSSELKSESRLTIVDYEY